jgi:hypothetical protein
MDRLNYIRFALVVNLNVPGQAGSEDFGGGRWLWWGKATGELQGVGRQPKVARNPNRAIGLKSG